MTYTYFIKKINKEKTEKHHHCFTVGAHLNTDNIKSKVCVGSLVFRCKALSVKPFQVVDKSM